MNFFKKLYEGNYAPIQDETPDTAEFKEQWEIMSKAEEKLRNTFTEEQIKLFEEHQKAQLEIENMLHIQTFEKGFCIGAEFQRDFKGIDHLPEEE